MSSSSSSSSSLDTLVGLKTEENIDESRDQLAPTMTPEIKIGTARESTEVSLVLMLVLVWYGCVRRKNKRLSFFFFSS